MKRNIILVAPLEDHQTGEYLFYALTEAKHNVAPFDMRRHYRLLGKTRTNKKLIKDVIRLQPDLVLILKGLEIDVETIKELKKHSKVATWIFDVTLGGKPIELDEDYIKYMKENNYFFSFCKGNVKKLRDLGINAIYLREGYHPKYSEVIPVNSYEKKKFGEDVTKKWKHTSEWYHIYPSTKLNAYDVKLLLRIIGIRMLHFIT